MGGGRLRRPPLIKLSILYEENPKIYTKTQKYTNIHIGVQNDIKICKNIDICKSSTILLRCLGQERLIRAQARE